ncbi:hypothetical protein H7347_07240 [Corynebacterium sp. zg-331]|uniref:hypothetical protein n=1 Tax=unclassified Corynebacterium TaxID=2624378 RepID=UPI00128DDB72|nr:MULTISPECIES: hypothetical protein [unclassified Corynebacterium]MBC3186367.1 hypothetical protein [Corynebacterium sp. zg-331]MPV52854.1 hypothetical protein [Corynebacterium sp. zg331]
MGSNRIDLALVIRDALRAVAPGAAVELGRDATYRPDETVTVVQQVSLRPAMSLPGARLAFRAVVALSTTGPSWDEVMEAHEALADGILSLSDACGVHFSSVRCDSEPAELPPHNPSGAQMVASTYSMIVRRSNG